MTSWTSSMPYNFYSPGFAPISGGAPPWAYAPSGSYPGMPGPYYLQPVAPPSGGPPKSDIPWTEQGGTQWVLFQMEPVLLDSAYQLLKNRYLQAFIPHRPMEENIQAVAQLIGLPMRAISIDSAGQVNMKEYNGATRENQRPDADKLETLKKRSILGLMEYFRDGRIINFYNLAGLKQSNNPDQAIATLGHELFHTAQERDGIGTFDMAEESSMQDGAKVLQEMMHGQSAKFETSERLMRERLAGISDRTLLSSVITVAKVEYQAHDISGTLAWQLGNGVMWQKEMEQKARYGLIAMKAMEHMAQVP